MEFLTDTQNPKPSAPFSGFGIRVTELLNPEAPTLNHSQAYLE